MVGGAVENNNHDVDLLMRRLQGKDGGGCRHGDDNTIAVVDGVSIERAVVGGAVEKVGGWDTDRMNRMSPNKQKDWMSKYPNDDRSKKLTMIMKTCIEGSKGNEIVTNLI